MKQENLQSVVTAIVSEKQKFMQDLQSRIETTISKKRKRDCISVVTISPSGRRVTWNPDDGVQFYPRFWAFLWNKPSYIENNVHYKLDSGLTEDILKEVTACYQALVLRHKGAIVDLVRTEIITNETMKSVFLNTITQDKRFSKLAVPAMKRMLTDTLLHGVQCKFQEIGGNVASDVANKANSILMNTISSGIASKTVAIAAKAATSGAGKVLITKLSLAISKALGPILVKILAKPAITAMLKKYIMVAVIGSLAKFVMAKFGIGIGAAMWIVVVPLIILWIINDVKNFPEKLGRDLGIALTKELDSGFSNQVSEVITGLLAGLLSNESVKAFAEAMLADPDVVSDLTLVVNAIA